MEIVSWASDVNRIVTNESSITVGQNSVVSDTSENGTEMSRLTGSGTPERYTVAMWFSNSVTDNFYKNKGITEWQAFLNWFKYEACMGTKPFYFHHLTDPNNTTPQVYKISSSGLPSGNPNGEYIKCTMTWIQVFTDYITIASPVITADSISVIDGQIDFRFNEQPESTPKKSDFSATYQIYADGEYGSESELPIEQIDWDGYKSVLLYFQNLSTTNTYKVNVTYGTETVSSEFVIEG